MAEIKGEKKNILLLAKTLWRYQHNYEALWTFAVPIILISDDRLFFYSVFIQALGVRRASLFLLFMRYHDDPGVPLTS